MPYPVASVGRKRIPQSCFGVSFNPELGTLQVYPENRILTFAREPTPAAASCRRSTEWARLSEVLALDAVNRRHIPIYFLPSDT